MSQVSVIVPVYGVEAYIERCARCLMEQSLQDMEFLFVDDCSPDRSMEILRTVLEDYPARKPQVRILTMPVNSGQAAVRMRALAEARGTYVIHCDSDDYPEKDAYETLYRKAVEEDLDIVTCDYYEEDEKSHKVIKGNYNTVEELLTDTAPWSLFCRLVRRELLEGIVPPADNMGEDMVITLQATLKARSHGHVPRPLYHYCLRGGSISLADGKAAALRRWKSLRANMEVVLPLLKERYGYQGDEPALVRFKYYGRHHLEKFAGEGEFYRLWRETYPEVDPVILRTPGVTLEQKFWYVAIRLHVFKPIKKLTGKYGKDG